MNNLLVFLGKLNNEIPPASDVNRLYRKHSIALVDDTSIDVVLYPAAGGTYSIPVAIKGQSIDDIIDEIKLTYQRCKIIGEM